MRFFPAIISTIPAIFLILYRWGNILKFIASIFLKRNYSKQGNNSITKKEAYQILGLTEGASKKEILQSYQNLMKKNHPDLGGSDWITKKLNEARDILLG
jgi:preprotein translocase subunit Sec63|tara:strand:- start:117 stop:416 length:300 start_codon:yes stop_codon:yes gene_type:complete